MGSVRSARRAPLAAAALAVAAAVGCAGGSDAAPPSFSAVRSVAVVRRVERGEHRAKDPLDAVSESLRAKGIVVRTVELGGRDDPKDVARLFDAAASGATSPGARGAVALGADAGRTVRALGVDAVVTYHRLETPLTRALGEPYGARPGTPLGVYARPTAPFRPLGALEVVGTDGQAAVFDWGARDQPQAGAAETPAEAVDATVRALLGSPGGQDGV